MGEIVRMSRVPWNSGGDPMLILALKSRRLRTSSEHPQSPTEAGLRIGLAGSQRAPTVKWVGSEPEIEGGDIAVEAQVSKRPGRASSAAASDRRVPSRTDSPLSASMIYPDFHPARSS